MTDLERKAINAGLTMGQIKKEMEWLRCINFDDDNDVFRAALEIKLSILHYSKKLT